MATYRSHTGTTYATRTNTTLNVPSGVVNGDELIWYFLLGASGEENIPTPTFPSGWSTIVGPSTTDDTSFYVRSWTLRRRASSEPSSYTITHNSASSDGLMVAVQSAADDSSPPSSANPSNGNGNITFLGITTVAADACLLALCHNWSLWGSGEPVSGSTPTFTERQDSSSSLIHFSEGTWTSSGATGNKTKDSDNDDSAYGWSSHFVAIEEGSGSSTILPFMMANH